MQFRLLGAMDVRSDDGATIPIAAPKRRALLAALLLEHDRPSSSDRLAEALWGDEPPPAAEASLQAHMSRLRRDLGPGRITTLPAGYRIALAPGELDVRDFEQHLRDGLGAAAAGR
jgi:DNA-binding SARP family transcriptional activator